MDFLLIGAKCFMIYVYSAIVIYGFDFFVRLLYLRYQAQLVGAVEYADCISAEGKPHPYP